MATYFDSRVSVLLITTATGGSVDISSYVNSLEGIPGNRNLNDVTTFGATGHRYAPGLQEAPFTIDLFYSEDAILAGSTGGTDLVFGPLRTNSAAVAFSYYPSGTTGKLYSGNLWIENYEPRSKIGSAVLARVTGKVDNGVTRT